ncbi:MAG: M1 family aminopeptidase [Deltaproteobacteria bacterium]|nr:M1 family aminopeptidase [Deltaproteobacteria bacterium]
MRNVFNAFLLFYLLLSHNLFAQFLRNEYKTIVPKNRPQYKIEINLDLENRSYEGRERISFEYPFANNKGIVLRLFANSGTSGSKNLLIKSVRIDGAESAFKYRNDTTVEIKGEFKFKKRYTLDIEFSATLPEISDEDSDVFLSSIKQLLGLSGQKVIENNYGIFGCSSTVCNIAAPVPSIAKVYKDDWNISDTNGLGDYQRGDFSDYQMIITCDLSVVVVSNGVLKRSEKPLYGKALYTFEAEAVNDIVLEASYSFDYVRRETDGVFYSSFYTSESDKKLAESAIEIASDAVRFFSKYYAKYPYTELRIVAAPMTGGAGGVEFPALITIGDFLYSEMNMVQPEGRFVSRDLISQMFEFVIVHEIAHQWFSTLVPSDSRREPYLDEGLASFSAYLYFLNKYGDKEGRKFLENQIRLNYIMMRLLGYRDLPLDTPVEKYGNMFQYAGIIYGKAPLFFIRLRELIGDSRFGFLISNWVKERSFRDSDLKQFIQMLRNNEPEKASQIDSLYKRWFENTYGDEDIGKGTISDILRFLNEGEDVDVDLNLDSFRDWLENTFDMFRQYR